MKKTITVITLALLMVASLFANIVTPASGTTTVNSNNTATTEVVLTIAKTPTYIFGINKNASITIETANVPSTKIDNTDTIELTRYTAANTGKNVLDVKPNAEYKLSYLFYEYDAVTLTMSLSGNLKLADHENDTNATANGSEYQIPYLVKVDATDEKNQDGNTTKKSTAVTLDSEDTTTTWSTSDYTATTKLGQYVYSTLALTISPKYSSENTTNNTATLKGKTKGSYSSTITLTVTVA